MTVKPPDELTTAQVAEKLGVSGREVLYLVNAGHFPNARKLPGKSSTYLIPRSDVEQEIKRRQSAKAAD